MVMSFTDFRKCDGTQRLELVYPGVPQVGCFGERVRLNPCSCCVCVHLTCATRITDEMSDLNDTIRGSAGIGRYPRMCPRSGIGDQWDQYQMEVEARPRQLPVLEECGPAEFERIYETKALHSLPDFLVELILFSLSALYFFLEMVKRFCLNPFRSMRGWEEDEDRSFALISYYNIFLWSPV
jgi:hypothetical protein